MHIHNVGGLDSRAYWSDFLGTFSELEKGICLNRVPWGGAARPRNKARLEAPHGVCARDEDRLRAAASDESHFAGGADLDDLVRARVNLDLLALENQL